MSITKKPLFINIEGLDGVGKSTFAKYLAEHLRNKFGVSVKIIKAPHYDTETGAKVKEYLNGDINDYLSTVNSDDKYLMIYSLYCLDRIAFATKNYDELVTYDVIISDRSYISSLIYQGTICLGLEDDNSLSLREKACKLIDFMKKIDLEEIRPLKLYQNDPTFINVMLYHPDIHANMYLLNKTGKTLDIHETNIAYLKNVKYVSVDLVPMVLMSCDAHLNKLFGYSLIPCSFSVPSINKPTLFSEEDILSQTDIDDRVAKYFDKGENINED